LWWPVIVLWQCSQFAGRQIRNLHQQEESQRD
jgi:hypothetical protein